ncbi:MAG: hypothetical protein Q9165_007137 [Trypethelium subeluteriae]
MLHQHVLLALLAATSVSAVPLNINLGAYSPALVVGDGEISFAGTDGAGNLIEELESGAVSAGQQNGEATPSGAPSGAAGANIISPSEQAQASVASVASLAAASASNSAPAPVPTTSSDPAAGASPPDASSSSTSATESSTSSSTAADATSTNETPARAIKAGISPDSSSSSSPRPNLARRNSNTAAPAPARLHQRRSSKRAIESFSQLTETQRTTFRRDITGFREALNYAIQAQKNTPKIELGTENSGVGILVNPGLNVPQGSAAAGTPAPAKGGAAAPAAGKRSVEGESEERAGITLLAIAEI